MQLEAQLTDKNVEIELDEAARNWLAVRGYDATYGARPLARLVQEHIKKPLADELLFGKLIQGGSVKVGVSKDSLQLSCQAAPAQASQKAEKSPDSLAPIAKELDRAAIGAGGLYGLAFFFYGVMFLAQETAHGAGKPFIGQPMGRIGINR